MGTDPSRLKMIPLSLAAVMSAPREADSSLAMFSWWSRSRAIRSGPEFPELSLLAPSLRTAPRPEGAPARRLRMREGKWPGRDRNSWLRRSARGWRKSGRKRSGKRWLSGEERSRRNRNVLRTKKDVKSFRKREEERKL